MRATTDLPSFTKKVEGLGDVLTSVAASKTRPDSLKRGLEHLVRVSRRLVDLSRDTPQAFERATVPAKFRTMAETDLREVQFRAWLAPEIVFAGFQVPLEQFARIYMSAVGAGDDDAALEAASHLEDVIEHVASEPGSDTLAKMTLALTTRLTREAIEAKARVSPVVAWTWFDSVAVMHPSMNYRTFDLSYLAEFTSTLWRNVRWVIAHGGVDLFGSFVESAVNSGGHDFDCATDHDAPRFFSYDSSVSKQDQRLHDWVDRGFTLESQRQSLASLEAVHNWKSVVDEFVEAADHLLQEDARQELLRDSADWKARGESVLKMRAVASVLFSCGSYILFRCLPDYLPVLLDYAQPADADASWAGWHPFPTGLDTVLSRYVLPLSERDGFSFWEGRHGHTSYDEEFAVLLLARGLDKTARPAAVFAAKQDSDKPEPTEHATRKPEYRVSLKGLGLTQVKNVGWLVDRLERAVDRLRDKTQYLIAAGIAADRIGDLLDAELPAYLRALRSASESDERSQMLAMDLSEIRMVEFADNVSKAYSESASFRELLAATGHYRDRTGERREPRGLFGMNTLMPRSAFLDVPYEHWSMADEQLGRDLAGSLERTIAEAYLGACRRFAGGLDEALEKWETSSPIILTARTWDPDSLMDLRRFVTASGEEGLLPGQAGWYRKHDDSLVPVVEWHRLAQHGTVVGDLASLGELADFDPVPEDCPHAIVRKPLAVCIKEVADDTELAERLVAEQPEWFKEAPEGATPSMVLRLRVWLRVFESPEYLPPKEAGLLLTLDAEPDLVEED